MFSQLKPQAAPCAGLAAAMVAGVISDRSLTVSPVILVSSFTACLLASIVLLWTKRTECGTVVTGLLFLAAGSLSATWHHLWWHQIPADHVSLLIPDGERETVGLFRAVVDSPVTVNVINDEFGAPAATQVRSRCEVQIRQVFRSGVWCRASGRACLTLTGRLRPIPPGTKIHFSGFVVRYPTPSNSGESNSRLTQREKGFYCFLQSPYPECVRCEGRADVERGRAISHLRARWHQLLRRHLRADVYPLAAAVLLGLRDPMPTAQRDLYLRTGTIHLLSVSGMHVGLLAGALLFIGRGRPMRRKATAWLLVGFVVAFSVLVGGRTPVMRAGVLVILFSLSWMMLRPSNVANSLAAAAVWITCWRPSDVVSVGTQFSFLSVVALAWAGRQRLFLPPEDPLDRLVWRTRTPKKRIFDACCHQISRCLFASFVVWLTTAPLVAFHFHICSPVSVLLNAMLWIPLLVAMLTGVLLFAIEPCSSPVIECVAILCQAALDVIQSTVVAVDTWPMTHFWCGGPRLLGIVLYYACLGLLALSWQRRWPAKLGVLFVIMPLLLGLVESSSRLAPARAGFQCSFLAVGHGTCVVLQLPDGETWLYDAGRLGDTRRGVEIVSRFLWHRRIFKIDQVILSHLDIDHYSLIPALTERFAVERLVTNSALWEPRAARLRRTLEDHGVRLLTVSAGDRLDRHSCRIRVLGPSLPLDDENDNANSIVLHVESMGTSVILPGDLEGPRLHRMFQSTRIKAAVAMAPHHGSSGSQPSQFAEWCQADLLVVSSRSSHERLRARLATCGCELLQTAVHGAVELIATERGCCVLTARPPRTDRPHDCLGSRWRG